MDAHVSHRSVEPLCNKRRMPACSYYCFHALMLLAYCFQCFHNSHADTCSGTHPIVVNSSSHSQAFLQSSMLPTRV